MTHLELQFVTDISFTTLAGFLYFTIIELLDWYQTQSEHTVIHEDYTQSEYTVIQEDFSEDYTTLPDTLPKEIVKTWIDEEVDQESVTAYENLIHSDFTYFDKVESTIKDLTYTSEEITTPNLEEYSYRELQKLAKSRGLKAKVSREQLILSLA